jgi:hypothetical protein
METSASFEARSAPSFHPIRSLIGTGRVWTLSLVATHPEVAERIYGELDEVLAGCAATVADVQRLKYLECVVQETLRVYPPAWAVDRMALEDVDAAVGGAPPSPSAPGRASASATPSP